MRSIGNDLVQRVASQKAVARVIAGCLLAATTVLGGNASVCRSATIPYTNDFTSVGLANMAAQYTLDTGSGVLHYEVAAGGGAVVSTASEPFTNATNHDFLSTTRFTLNSFAFGSSGNATVGLGILGSTSDFLSTGGEAFYLADWNPFGTSPGTLRILSLGNDDGFTSMSTNVGVGIADETYELRLIGSYAGGTLNMSLRLYDSMGIQIGETATATDTSPLAGQFFGFRNRTGGSSHEINADFHHFNVVPEPSALIIAVVGGVGMLISTGRRCRQKAAGH